jgi:hypothetical protein
MISNVPFRPEEDGQASIFEAKRKSISAFSVA